MAYLIETSILTRLANASDVDYLASQSAIATLHRQNETLRTAPQNLVEFRNVATRPIVVNGLGYTANVAEAYSARFEANFPILT
ncbi:MAG: type II toxin-antitoxin system VapC family toxin, partial [Ktedonobacteraceae bacterium]